MNKVFLTGRLAQQPESRYTPSGKSVCLFSLAVERRGTGEAPDYIDIITWEQVADACSAHLGKGRRVGLAGRLQVRKFVDSDGKQRKITEVIASEVEFLDAPLSPGETK